MAKFTQHWASDYDQRIVRLIPGYDTAHEIASCVLAAELGDSGDSIDVLVVGAGTGREIDDLAVHHSSWRFIAVDPSQPMLDNARTRAEHGNYLDRVAFQAVDMQNYRATAPHAGATAMLVFHFLADDDGRLDFLRALAAALRPGAPLVTVDYAGDTRAYHDAYRQWARAQGQDEEAIKIMFQRLSANFHPIDEAHRARLFAEVGFGAPTRFFQALGYAGYVVRRS